MRPFLVFIFSLLISFSFLVPQVTSAAVGGVFDPNFSIIDARCKCDAETLGYESAPDWGCVLQTLQNIVNLAISLGVVFGIFVIAYAGLLWMTNSVNPHGREQAKTMLQHAVIGLLIALSAWLIVDFVMKVLYNPSTQGAGVTFGPWNSILSSGQASDCLVKREPPQGAQGTTPSQPTTGTQPGTQPGTPQDPGVTAGPPTQPTDTTNDITITVNSQTPVSQSAQDKLRQVLASANLTRATIVSGTRTPADQARIMEQNLNDNIRINYAAAGDAVTAVYDQMKAQGASRSDIRAAMEAEIIRQGCSNVSRHCSNQDVIDVSPGSISNRSAFETALQNSSLVARFYKPGELNEPGYHIEFR